MMMNFSKTIDDLLKSANINARRVKVLGGYVHIDTFEKYADTLKQLFGNSGAELVMERNGTHMDSFDGYRIVFKF